LTLTTLLAVSLIVAGGCDLLDPVRPSAQQDTEVFGNLLEVTRGQEDASTWLVRIQVGPPRLIRAAEEESGKPTPGVEQSLVATVTVGADTVVVAHDRSARLEDFDPGTEIVIIPVPGTTNLIGSNDLRVEADTIIDFATYKLWRLPNLESEKPPELDDPELINSSGVEIAPVPVAGGKVLYFTAQLRPPATEGEKWHGAAREGLMMPSESAVNVERSYRTELGGDGWTPPELVRFPGLEDSIQTRVTWVSEDETKCLVTVTEGDSLPWVGLANRSGAADPWQAPEMLDALGADAHDAVFLTGSQSKILFVSARGGRERGDLFLFDPKNEAGPMPLEPRICTFGTEWNPRTGPQGELFFCREDRQLVFRNSQVGAVRLPGPHRVLFTQAAPTADGNWLFFCMPRYRPLQFDEDIYVASLDEGLATGEPVPVDEWRP
jgi:hypothetical protein